jgi:hypothetical protein
VVVLEIQRGPVKVNLSSAELADERHSLTHLPLVVRLIVDGGPCVLEEMPIDQWPKPHAWVEVLETFRLVSSE